MKKAVVVSYNWNTRETLTTDFEGEGCAMRANAWVAKDGFLYRDFPEIAGWVHFTHRTPEAGEELLLHIRKTLLTGDAPGPLG